MSFHNLKDVTEDEHDSSPVCRVLRSYFKRQQERNEEIEQLRRGQSSNPLAQIGVNDVVQEG